MREELEKLPGVSLSFTQPIALRVDELVSGVTSAIGIKISGDDLDLLAKKGDGVTRVLSTVRGAADVSVEKVDGLAYLQIEIDREKSRATESMSLMSRASLKPRSAGRKRPRFTKG